MKASLLFAPEIYYLLMGLALFLGSLRKKADAKTDFQTFLALAGGGVLICCPKPLSAGRTVFRGLQG